MTSARSLAIPILWAMLATPLIHAQDLSGYREFPFGMDLLSVAKKTDMKPTEAKVLHQRPAMIQELWWRGGLGSAIQKDPLQEVVFSFYNDELFRMVVHYDRYKTEGLTDEDMIEAISARYGVATRPAARTVVFSSSLVFNESEKVIACWEDAQSSFNLVRSSHQPSFWMVVFSKRLEAMARAATLEAVRQDEADAPRLEIERQKKLEEETRIALAKARLANKAGFRP